MYRRFKSPRRRILAPLRAAAPCSPLRLASHLMNPVEIEEAVSQLAEAPFDPETFPYAFLEAFGNKQTTIKRLKSARGGSNHSDLPDGVLQRSNIHLRVCAAGQVAATLTALRASPATARHKAKFILATDGQTLEAENLAEGETVACDYADFHDHFGFFLPLAGITTIKQIRENAFDIKATGRLNRLYLALLKENPGWEAAARREALNHFMARLIFCFFAEDTNIFEKPGLFTDTVTQMSARDAANTHEVLAELFRAMRTPTKDRGAAQIRNWAAAFPYVNGGLFSDVATVPRFSKIARSYLLHVGNLDWKKINPDIFGSMIQAVADDEKQPRYLEQSALDSPTVALSCASRETMRMGDMVEEMLIKTTTAQAPWTIVAANNKHYARIKVLQTVVERLAAELNVEATPEALADLPPLAAPTPIPQWALDEAAALGVKVKS